MFGWSDRATTAEVKWRMEGTNPGRVVLVGYGQYEVTIPDDPEAPVTYKSAYRVDSDPRRTFPNMEVRDGEMRLPLEDIVSAILARVEPAEIAVALWGDDTVRKEFMDALVTRYNERNISDADRRQFLAGVKEAVHSKALDRLADAMASKEYAAAQRFSVWQAVGDINATLAHYEVTRPPRDGEEGPQPLRMIDPTNGEEFKIGGTAWNEARSHWRSEALRQFPMPAQEPAERAEAEIA